MNKKGFTLIELLAVIVILAVIALIATPVIMNAISNAKQGAWKDAAYGIIKATENVYAKNFSEVTEQVDTFFLYEYGVMTSYPSGKTIDYKGSVPQDGGIVLHSDGSITLAIYDGVNCAVKTKTDTTVSISTTDKATCISNIYYKQATAPFTNLVTNGDFSNGTTGWNAQASTLSASNNTLIITGNGASPEPSAYRGIGVQQNNDKLFVKISAKVTNSELPRIDFYCGTLSQRPVIKYSPLQNQWYYYTGIVTASGSYNTIIFYHNYSTSANANEKVMEVRNVLTLNLTKLYGAGNEPTNEQMDNNLNKVWIDSSTNTPKRFTAGGWVNF